MIKFLQVLGRVTDCCFRNMLGVEACLIGVFVCRVIEELVFILAFEELMPARVNRFEQGVANRVIRQNGKTGFMQGANKLFPRIIISAIDASYNQWTLVPLRGKLCFSSPLVDSSGHDQEDREQDVTASTELQDKVIIRCGNDLARNPWADGGPNAAAE